MKLIDIHHHVIGKNNPNAASLPEWNMELDAAALDRMGIAGALLSLPVASTPEQIRTINDFLAGFMTYDPKRYGMLACLPSAHPEAALKEIEYALDTLKADGFIMPSNAGGIYIGDDRMDEILAELDRRSAVVLVHPVKPAAVDTSLFVQDMSIYEFPFDTSRAVMDLIYRGKIQKYPNIRWIVSHAGGVIPYIAYRLSTVAEESKVSGLSGEQVINSLKTLYYDVALSTAPSVFATLKELVGASQILFGTDLPLRCEKGTTESIATFQDSEVFTDDEKQMIAFQTSQKLFPRFQWVR